MFAAVLDTCVLWSGFQRDFLLSLAAEGLYRPLWNSDLLEELEWCEIDKRTQRGQTLEEAEQLASKLISNMGYFDDSLIAGWEPLVGTFGLPDPDDEHVLATAVLGSAGVIVTDNVKDFPKTLLPVGIEIIRPPQFAANTVAVSPALGLAAVGAMATRRSDTVERILARLESGYGMTEAVELIRAESAGD